MPPKEKPPRKRLKITHNAAAKPNEPETNEPDNVGINPDSAPGVAKPPAAPHTDADNVGPDTSTATSSSSVPKPKPVLDGITLIPEIRLEIYNHLVNLLSAECGFERDHSGRFICSIDRGLHPYFTHDITIVPGLSHEYLAEVFKRAVFTFTSIWALKWFTFFIHSRYNHDPAQVPYLHIKVNILHTREFPPPFLKLYKPTDVAHGRFGDVDGYIRE